MYYILCIPGMYNCPNTLRTILSIYHATSLSDRCRSGMFSGWRWGSKRGETTTEQHSTWTNQKTSSWGSTWLRIRKIMHILFSLNLVTWKSVRVKIYYLVPMFNLSWPKLSILLTFSYSIPENFSCNKIKDQKSDSTSFRLREAAKNFFYFNGRAINSCSPPLTPRLSGQKNY